jgi:hypothetical protein
MTDAVLMLVAVLGVQAPFTASAGAAPKHGTATLTVEVKGLPRHVRGNVKLAGPGRNPSRITATTKLKSIASGTYTISAQPVRVSAGTYSPTITLCPAAGRCSSPSRGAIAVKSGQRLTVRVIYAAGKGAGTPGAPASPIGVTPSSPGGGGTLAAGKSETGGWSAAISVPAGGPQMQADGVISYPVQLAERPKAVYLSEKESEEPTKAAERGCPGNVNQPEAKPGFLCVFTGGSQGSKESQWKNAKFAAFEEPNGVESEEGGRTATLVVFRTGEFSLGAPVKLLQEAMLTAAGSWAVTARG